MQTRKKKFHTPWSGTTIAKAVLKVLPIYVLTFIYYSRVDTDVLMEVAYSCNFLAVSDSSTCPGIGTSWCHAGIIEHFEIRGFKMTP